MSLDSAMKVLNATPAPQQQALNKQEVAAATVEAESKPINDTKIAEPATDKGVVAEATKPAETTSAPTEPALSSKFAALTKKEKAIVERDQKTKTYEASVKAREEAVAAREAKIAASEALWETDVFAAIKERTGMDYNALTLAQLDGKYNMPQETDPVKIAKKTIEDFKKEQAAEKTRAAEEAKKAAEELTKQQQEELKAAWETYNAEVQTFVESNADTYELINMYNQTKLIAETVDEFYKANKRVLSIKEAADIVESYLEAEAKKALSSKKLGTKAPEVKKDEEPVIQRSTPKTLNNGMQPTSASALPVANDTDRMKRALAALDKR